MAHNSRADVSKKAQAVGHVAARDRSESGVDGRLELYRAMRLIRSAELEIESMHHEGVMTGSFHSSMGQESAAAGVCAVLRPGDLVSSTHRGHGHAIAKGVPLLAIFAELLGREGGASGGRGGSMHLHHRESGFLGENAIVAGGMPWAAGAAWARRRLGHDDIGVAFTGDGGAAQGLFHETLRLALFFNSPCLFVCENNGLAHSMPSDDLFGKAGTITQMVAAIGMRTAFVDGRDVTAVRAVAAELVDYVRRGRPALIECAVFRVRAHSLSDPEYRYRAKDAGSTWLKSNDPIERLKESLDPGAQKQCDVIDESVRREVTEARERALAMVVTPPTAATAGVYGSDELNNY
jgi:TPP-dependent pyruvate/acetoin dehydrogenase alpha subunit